MLGIRRVRRPRIIKRWRYAIDYVGGIAENIVNLLAFGLFTVDWSLAPTLYPMPVAPRWRYAVIYIVGIAENIFNLFGAGFVLVDWKFGLLISPFMEYQSGPYDYSA